MDKKHPQLLPTEQYYDIWQQSMEYIRDRTEQREFVNDGIWFIYETSDIETEQVKEPQKIVRKEEQIW